MFLVGLDWCMWMGEMCVWCGIVNWLCWLCVVWFCWLGIWGIGIVCWLWVVYCWVVLVLMCISSWMVVCVCCSWSCVCSVGSVYGVEWNGCWWWNWLWCNCGSGWDIVLCDKYSVVVGFCMLVVWLGFIINVCVLVCWCCLCGVVWIVLCYSWWVVVCDVVVCC